MVRHQIEQFGGPITWAVVPAEGSVDDVVGRVLTLIVGG